MHGRTEWRGDQKGETGEWGERQSHDRQYSLDWPESATEGQAMQEFVKLPCHAEAEH